MSRNVASMKAFFHYACRKHKIENDPTEKIKAPHIEKKMPDILSKEETVRLLEQPAGDSPKELRDRAMLELLYATGVRVTELISLEIPDVQLGMNYIVCRDAGKERVIPFGENARRSLERYLRSGRDVERAGKQLPVCELFRKNDEPPGVLEADQAICIQGRDCGRYYSAYVTSFFCGPSGAKWR